MSIAPMTHLISPTTPAPVTAPVNAPVIPLKWRAHPRITESALKALGDYLVGIHGPAPDVIDTMRELTRRAGGDHLPAPLFRAILLDISDCASRVPPSVWLGLCRGLALGASLGGEEQALPLPLQHAASSLLKDMPLRPGRRVAMAQALML